MSKIPEGATHFAAHLETYPFIMDGEPPKYFRIDRWVVGACEKAYWRPITEHPDYVAPVEAWNGEGLPPVGAVCAVFGEHSKRWYKCEIVFSSDWVVVARGAAYEGKKVDIAYDYTTFERRFRPIRTPEQIAAEERNAGIEEMLTVFWAGGSNELRRRVEQLYDAGYRKCPST